MKRILCLFAVMMMVLSLFSCQKQDNKVSMIDTITCTECKASIKNSSSYCSNCGNKTNAGNESVPTQDELLASAEKFNLSKFIKDCGDNLPRAQETYVGKVYTLSGFVSKIEEDRCTVGNAVVPLNKDIIADLSVGDCISVVGRVGNVTREENTYEVGIGTHTRIMNTLIMDVAYYIGDVTTFTAEVIYLATNGGLVMLLDEFDGRYCGIQVSLTQNEVDQFKYGDVINIEGNIVTYDNSQSYSYAGKRYSAYLKIFDATIEKP